MTDDSKALTLEEYRAEVMRTTACPECLAQPGELCVRLLSSDHSVLEVLPYIHGERWLVHHEHTLARTELSLLLEQTVDLLRQATDDIERMSELHDGAAVIGLWYELGTQIPVEAIVVATSKIASTGEHVEVWE